MYVCVCGAVTERQIRRAVKGGVMSFEELCMELPVARCCGRCEPFARSVLADAAERAFPVLPRRVTFLDRDPLPA